MPYACKMGTREVGQIWGQDELAGDVTETIKVKLSA